MTEEEVRAHFDRRPFEPLFIKLIGEDGSCYEVHDPGYTIWKGTLGIFQGPDRENTLPVRLRHIEQIRPLSEVKG